MRDFFGIVLAVCVFFVCGTAFAQDPDHVLSISDESGMVGGEATVSFFLDISTAPNNLAGWSWGVCHDSLVDLCNPMVDPLCVDPITLGADAAALNGGSGPNFFAPAVFEGMGWTVGAVVNLLGGSNLPIGGPYELHQGRYMLLAPGLSTLNYCSTLGNPVVETVLVDTATPSNTVVPTLMSGSIMIAPPPGGLSFTAADGLIPMGGPGGVSVTLDNDNDEVEAFSFGVSHDDSVATLNSIDPGAVVAAANGGMGPDFFGPDATPVGGPGGTLGCLISIGGPGVIGVGAAQEIAVFNYTAVGAVGDMTTLAFTNTLGDPPVPIVATINSMSMAPQTFDGSITVDMGVVQDDMFFRGDANNDAFLDISDAQALGEALFGTGPALTCDDLGDTNDDGVLDPLGDTMFLLMYLFLEGDAVPFPNFYIDGVCGLDPIDPNDPLGCVDYQGMCP